MLKFLIGIIIGIAIGYTWQGIKYELDEIEQQHKASIQQQRFAQPTRTE